MTKMTREESEAYHDALEEWLDLRDELESERTGPAFVKCEAARERAIDALAAALATEDT